MEEQQEGGVFQQILPPRLEDAGLEDCALPPDSIKEAFLKAASAVKSRAASIFTENDDDEEEEEDEMEGFEGDCVKDPWPTAKDTSDTVVGVWPEKDAPGPCGNEKGGGEIPAVGPGDVEERGDKVVVVGGEEEEKTKKKKACVEGLKGLEIREKVSNGDDEEKEDEEKPILIEGFV